MIYCIADFWKIPQWLDIEMLMFKIVYTCVVNIVYTCVVVYIVDTDSEKKKMSCVTGITEQKIKEWNISMLSLVF